MILPVLALALVGTIALALSTGAVAVPLGNVWTIVGHRLLPRTFGAPDPAFHDQIVWSFRLPRALLGALVGAALALVGAVLQAVVRNPLAEPYVLGVSAGASLGAVAVAVLGTTGGAITLSGGAFVGALIGTVLLYALAQRGGHITPYRFVLSGVALAYFFQAAYSYLLLQVNPFQTRGILFFLLGSLASATWSDLGLPSVTLAVGIVLLLLRARSLNALVIGAETAASLGVNVKRLRVELLLLTSLLVGVMVAVSGAIAFVGLIVPHAVRLAIGADHRRLLPCAALAGAVFLVLVDLAARTIDEPNELPLTIVTAAFGVPFFLWLLRRRDRGDEAVYG